MDRVVIHSAASEGQMCIYIEAVSRLPRSDGPCTAPSVEKISILYPEKSA